MTEQPSPIIEHDGGVLIRGQALPLVYRSLFSLRLRQHRDGIAPTPLLTDALRVLYRACTEPMSSQRHLLDTRPDAGALCDHHDSDLVDSAAAAEILGLSRRSVQRLTSSGQLPAVRVGSIWLYRKAVVMDLAREREASA